MPVYALVVGKKGAKLKESAASDTGKPSCKFQTAQQRTDGLILRTYACQKTSMEQLANMLPRIAPAYVDLPAVDLTELKGEYDFTLEWTPRGGGRGATGGAGDAAAGRGGDIPSSSEPDGRTVFDTLQSQLGLKLERRKHPMDILVIDKVERVPTDN